MPQNKTETVTFKLPSGEMVDAIIPAGMSDAEAKAFMVAKKPDLFRTSSARTPQEAGVLPPEMQAREAIFKNMGMSFGSTRPDPLPEQEFRGTRVENPLHVIFSRRIDDKRIAGKTGEVIVQFLVRRTGQYYLCRSSRRGWTRCLGKRII